MFNWIKQRKWVLLNVVLAVMLVSLIGINVDTTPTGEKVTITIGPEGVLAAGDLDYTLDGVADDVQFQAALDALPAAGGRLVVVSATTINFTATVTRAIGEVTIEGSGLGTYFANDGGTALFTAGGNNWVFKNFSCDYASGINFGATTGGSMENVLLNTTYYAYWTDDDVTADEWAIPTGRGATFIVAASDAPAHVKAQADYVCDGTADDVEIQAAIDAVVASGSRGSIRLWGSFSCTSQIDAGSNTDVYGPAIITITSNSNIHGVVFDTVADTTWRGIVVNRAGTTSGSQIFAVQFTGTIDHSVKFLDSEANNSVNSSGAGCFAAGLYIGSGSGTYYDTEPYIQGCTITSTGSGTGGAYGVAFYHGSGNPELLDTYVNTTNKGSAVYLTEWTGNAILNNVTGRGYSHGFSTDGGTYTLSNCHFYAGLNPSGNVAGIRLGNSGSGKIYNTNGYSAAATYTYGLYIMENNETVIQGGYFGPPNYDQIKGWILSASTLPDNGQFRPDFTDANWCISGIINLYFTGANPGVTLDIGTTIGGNQIANNIDVSAGGAGNQVAVAVANPSTITAGNYLYATLSGNYTGTLWIAWTSYYDYSACNGVQASGQLDTGRTLIRDAVIVSGVAGNDIAVYLKGTPVSTNITFENCYIRTLGTFAPAYADNTFARCPFHQCVLEMAGGTFSNYLLHLPVGDNTYKIAGIDTILRGQIRTVSIPITAGVQNTVTSIQNTFGGDVLIIEAYVMISTSDPDDAPTYDMGTDDDGAGAPSVANNLFDAIPDTTGYYRSTSNGLGSGASGVQTQPILWQAVGNDWVNFIITDDDGDGTVGTIYITVIGK